MVEVGGGQGAGARGKGVGDAAQDQWGAGTFFHLKSPPALVLSQQTVYQMSQQNVVFKVSSSASAGFRRFSLSPGSFSFEELQQRLASITLNSTYTVSYTDDDGDEVAIGSDSELLETVRVMQLASPNSNPLVIRLKLVASQVIDRVAASQ